MNSKQRKKATTNKKPQKNILASAEIKHGVDTDILNEDIFNEIILDRNGRSNELIKNEWFLMFDKTNAFLKGLLSLINNSTTLRSVLASKTAFVLGEGFEAIEADTTPIIAAVKKLVRKFTGTPQQLKDFNDCLLSINQEGETLEEVTEKLTFDFCGVGNCYAEIVKTTEGGQSVVYLNHIPTYKVGISKDKKKFAISQNWNDSQRGENIEVVPKYPEFTSGPVKKSIIHLKKYAIGYEFFGLPEWISARLWAEIEYRIPKYNITKFKNGFTPSAFAQFFGAMTEEEGQELINGITATFSDTGNNSKIFAQVLRDEAYKMNIEILEDKSEGKFLELSKLASQALVTSNRWTMSLAGFATGGKLGTNQQIRDEIEFVTNTSVKGIRRALLQRIINPYVKELSEAKGGAFNGLRLDILNLTPVSIASMIDANKALLVNEKRSVLGFDSLNEEQEQQLKEEQQNI